MYKYTEDFLLIYFQKAKYVDYEELTLFLDLSFPELLMLCKRLEQKGMLTFKDGSFETTEIGMKTIQHYDLEAFDCANQFKLKDNESRYCFKEVEYIPKNFVLR